MKSYVLNYTKISGEEKYMSQFFKIFIVTFASIFVAELGDKTQLATISFTADNAKYKWIVFFAAASALCLTTFLGVFFGHLITKFVSPKTIKITAALIFIIIGVFMFVNAIREKDEAINENIIKLNAKILEIQKIEKCRTCRKFNDFINDKSKIIDKKIVIEKTNIHEPFHCENCNTDMLGSILTSEKSDGSV